MIKLQLALGVVVFIVWVYTFVSVVMTPDNRIRHLPKVAWILLVLLFPLLGTIAWYVAGRPTTSGPRRAPGERATPAFPEYDRPGRMAATEPGKDEEFLRQVRARAEEQRRRHEQTRRPKSDPPPEPETSTDG